jgi:hypothetical protein
VHFPPGVEPIGNKETPSAYCPPHLHLFQTFFGGFIKLKYDLETLLKNLKALSGSSPVFVLSKYTIFGQTQTGVTFPLTSLQTNRLQSGGFFAMVTGIYNMDLQGAYSSSNFRL